MIDTINQLTGLAQVAAMNYPPGMASRIKLAGEITTQAIPESVRNTRDSIRKRSAGALALAGVTAAQVYADDNIFYGLFAKVKEMSGNSLATAWGITSLAAASFQAFIARKNQRHVAPHLAAAAYAPKEDSSSAVGFKEKLGESYASVKEHLGKMSVTMFALGVPGHVMVTPMTKKEVYGHAALWGATAPFFYTIANVSFGALDNPAAPFGIAAAITGTRYINEAWGRAGEAAIASTGALEATSREVFALPSVVADVA